ncbi:MAG TPA: ectonucleotide pyrophosphatase/phosphodiesterase, partial [Planctomycetota bacterium]|nr:ectonucleotide pyrophosphatase/phosphodiesterase [Planctomycetota bacterium]
MKRWIALLLLELAACSGPGAPTGARPAAEPTVIVISLDGFPAYLFQDPRLPAPTLLRMMREGASAKGMTIVNPTVTWPNHTTLATGVPPVKHGVLYNGLLIVEPGKAAHVEPRTRADLVRVPTVYDVAHRAGLKTAQVDWIPWQTGGTIDWAFEEVPNPKGQVEQEMIAAGLAAEQDFEEFKKGNIQWRDLMWTRAAVHILKSHRPNLMYFHLLNIDGTHHRYGPRTPAGMSAIALADARVAELLAALDQSGLRDQTTVIVVSDHGFKGTKRSIRPNAALAQAGYLRVDGGKIAAAAASVVPEGGTAMVYLRTPEAVAAAAKIQSLLGALEGVDRVIEPGEFAALGMPLPQDNSQMADLILVAKPGYGFAAPFEGEPV